MRKMITSEIENAVRAPVAYYTNLHKLAFANILLGSAWQSYTHSRRSSQVPSSATFTWSGYNIRSDALSDVAYKVLYIRKPTG
ncbi:hypothetical protein PoB_006079600 [Plakobranchus ocellatus]|uniref:Uncharacterized protein n=1 Tax=Plakobranchus ocellatus TaxID=259542 RepID=A0AAV4CR64_9GAST|nr:hypothetical protein PoB_006079600 [Plakobranchus ocellatus]